MSEFSLDNVKIILQDIVNTEFPNTPEKRRITKRSSEFAIACPYCGDSHKNNSRKRGTLYFNSFRYRCFNCGHKTTLLGLMNNYNIHIEPHQKLQIIEYVEQALQRIHFSEDEFITKDLDKLIDIKELENYFNTDIDSQLTNFKPIEKNSIVYKYLTNRKIYDFENLYEGIYHYTKDWSEPVLININQCKGKVLGIQTRNLKADRNKRIYKIFSFSELWKFLNPNIEIDEIEKIGYNRLSYLYNILNVNWEEPITIFEGFLDTKFFPNSIGCIGSNTDLTFILNQEANIRFIYDYDNTGIKKAKELLKKGYSVFLWEKLFDFWASKTKDISKAGRKLRKLIVDLNDVGKLIKDPYSKLELVNWFSKDEFDLIYIK